MLHTLHTVANIQYNTVWEVILFLCLNWAVVFHNGTTSPSQKIAHFSFNKAPNLPGPSFIDSSKTSNGRSGEKL